MTAAVVCRLSTDELADAVDRTRALAAQRCVSPRFVRIDEPTVGNVENVPAEWLHVAALPPGHTVAGLLGALIRDGIAGNLDPGAGLLACVEIRTHEPAGATELGLTEDGRALVDAGTDLGRRLAEFAPRARYGTPAVFFESAEQSLRHVAATMDPRRSAVRVTRAIDLSTLWLLASAIADHERGYTSDQS